MSYFLFTGRFYTTTLQFEAAPEDFYKKQGLSSYSSTVHELLKKRSKDFTIGLMTDKRMFLSVIPLWETDGTRVKNIKLMPIKLCMKGNKSDIGLPRRSSDSKIAEYLGNMCAPYGIKVVTENDGLLSLKW